MSGYLIRLAKTCLFILTICSPAASAEALEWTVWPLPGVVNVVDGKPTDGITMEALDLLMARLPDLQADYRLANRLRQQRLMKNNHNFCSIPLLQREDSDELGYFIPFMASTPIQAVIRHGDLAKFPLEDGRLSLARLMSETELQGGISGFRTYPGDVHTWIRKAVAKGRVETVTGAQGGENLMLMVSHGRLDFIFEFASISRYMSKALRMREPLLSLPIHEEQKLVETGIYCTRNEWGRNMASRIDQAVREIAAEPAALMELYVAGMPEETWQAFSTEMAKYYQQRAKRSVVFEPAQ